MPRDTTLRSTFPRLSALAAAPRESRAMLTFDTTLAWAALLLLAIGLVMVYSASIATAEAMAYTGYRPWYFLARHAVFVAAGIAGGVRRLSGAGQGRGSASRLIFSSAGHCSLVAVLVPGIGKAVNGSKRWLSLVVVNVQPSEFMKLFVVLYAASYAVRKADFLHAQQPLKQTLAARVPAAARGDGR